MKNVFASAVLAIALLTVAAPDSSAQGRGKHKAKHQHHQQVRDRRDTRAAYPAYNGYGKNHGSYQGRGRKVGHYNKAVRPAPAHRNDVVVQQRQPGSFWNIFGRR